VKTYRKLKRNYINDKIYILIKTLFGAKLKRVKTQVNSLKLYIIYILDKFNLQNPAYLFTYI